MRLPALFAFVVVAAGCPAPSGHQLWVALDGAEARLKLVDHDPAPF